MGFAPIQNAKNVLLNQNPGSLPDVSGALLEWFQPLIFTKITKETVNFQLRETQTEVNTFGVIQPLSGRNLQMKPEGQRKWDWQQLHAAIGTPLAVDDIVVSVNLKDGNTPYRIMSKKDYSAYGYIVYELQEDYTT